MDGLLSTIEVGELAGVGPTAVKRWADRGLLPCVRTAGGHRRFRREEVERFLQRQQEPAAAMADLLLQSEGLGVEARLLAERSRHGSWVAVAESLGPVLVEIGSRWERGLIGVIDEHMASERLARALSRLAETLPTPPGAPRALLACAEQDDHGLGLALVELALREAGWRTLWTGRKTPATEVSELVRAGAVDLVALSGSMASTDAAALARDAALVGLACKEAGVPLAIGGSAPWPDPPQHGRRFHAIRPFAEWVKGLEASA
jgi:excisionase family DNA binding protein